MNTELKGSTRRDARWIGAVAVAITITVFSFASTLVKRANTPAELIAFWRMLITALIWNAVLFASGSRPSWAHIKRAALPGVFFGLDIAFFYLGATHNSVANAEMIGAMTPFIVVPIGAWLFAERLNPRALFFAVFAFAGVSIVLFAAPASGDASLLGSLFGVIALTSWAGYIVGTRRTRGEMTVAQYMAAMTPTATLAVLPLAVLHGGMVSISRSGWGYILLVAVMTGVVAHGLMVLAQATIPIGTIGVAQIGQPALAAVWSFIILGEVLNGWQLAGMALVIAGLLGFVLLNQRGRGSASTNADDEPSAPLESSEGSGTIG